MSEKQSMRKTKLDQLSQKLMILLAVLVVVCIGLFVWIWSLTSERQQLREEIELLKAAQDGMAGQVLPGAEPTEQPEDVNQPEAELEETPAKYFDIVPTGDDACTITGYSGKDLDVVIPKEINGQRVTKIGRSAFYGEKVTSVVLPEGVTEIEEYAFADCDKLIDVTIPETVVLIGDYAFDSCDKLASVAIPGSVAEIGDFAFNDCYKLQSVEFAEGLLRLGEKAFNNCRMKTVRLPDTLTDIGRGAFINCMFLTTVELPKNLTAISEEMFNQCLDLASIELPPTVVSIGSSAFSNCVRLKEAHIPDSVQEIGRDAFAECDSLVVFVSRDSYAAKWAMDNDIDREYGDDEALPTENN